MRVLVIGLDSRAARPQTESYAVRWAREMSRHVDEYVVLCQSDDGSTFGPVPLAPNAVAYAIGAGGASYSARAARFARDLHARQPFDVCTTEDPFRAGLAGLLFSQKTGVALNVENHSLHINNPDWLSARTRNRLYNRIGLAVLRRADTIRNYSADQAPDLLAAGVSARRLFTVPPPAPEPNPMSRAEARAALGWGADERVVLSAGRMVPVKNGTGLLNAFAIVAKHRSCRLVMAGDGPERGRWEQHARSLGLDGRVDWAGAVPDQKMPLLFAAADLFATASCNETGPRTVLEAFAAGVPSVGTHRMGVVATGVLAHGETGFVVDPDDAIGMAEAMDLLLGDPGWASRMGSEGRRRLAPMNYANTARRMLAVFKETIRRRSVAGAEIPEPQRADGHLPAGERAEAIPGEPAY